MVNIIYHRVTVLLISDKTTFQSLHSCRESWSSSSGCFYKSWQKAEAKAHRSSDLSVVLSDYTAGSPTITSQRSQGRSFTLYTHPLSQSRPSLWMRGSVCSGTHSLKSPGGNPDWRKRHLKIKTLHYFIVYRLKFYQEIGNEVWNCVFFSLW